MKKVLLITNSKQRCGVHDYARACFDILKKSTRYSYEFLPINQGEPESYYIEYLNSRTEDILLFNHCPWTMPWLSVAVLASLKKTCCMISGHDDVHGPLPEIAQYFYVDPTQEFKPALYDHPRRKTVPRPLEIGRAHV